MSRHLRRCTYVHTRTCAHVGVDRTRHRSRAMRNGGDDRRRARRAPGRPPGSGLTKCISCLAVPPLRQQRLPSSRLLRPKTSRPHAVVASFPTALAQVLDMSQEALIHLGTQAVATRLFSYPNLGHESDSLEATARHYLAASLAREGLTSATLSVVITSRKCFARISGLTPTQAAEVQARYQRFFDAGIEALKDFDALATAGKVHESWRFLLPLGIPLAFARAVEIMDFPPVTLLEKQDYMNSKTTGRWWQLLQVNAIPSEDLARYSCILDIAPVAAPARDGAKLDASGLYAGAFDDYGFSQLESLSRIDGATSRRPLIALGMPIRAWISRNWALKLEVLELGALTLKSGASCNVLVSNHP